MEQNERIESFSNIKRIETSYNAYINPPPFKRTDAMVMGLCLHEALFESDIFNTRLESSVKGVETLKYEKEFEENGLMIPKGKTEIIIKASEIIKEHPAYQEITKENEAHLVEKRLYGEIRERKFKGRLDYIDITNNVIIDLKTVNSLPINSNKREWWLKDSFYSSQLALYNELARQSYERTNDFICYLVVYGWTEEDLLVLRLSDKTLEDGYKKLNEWIDKIDEVEYFDKYKGINDKIIVM